MKQRKRGKNVWAVVLAAGEGSRMAPLTRALYGRETPKQFAALDGDKTLIQRTMDRIAPVILPSRTVVVVSESFATLAKEQLRDYPGVEIVSQPLNVGTGPGILLPLAHVSARDPEAAVAIFPSDHHVRRTGPFCEAVTRAVEIASLAESGVSLLGAAAERAATDLGWIVPGTRLGGSLDRAWRVQRFVEKPPEALAMALLGNGGLWNTMVIAGRATALWDLAAKHLPHQTDVFRDYLAKVAEHGADAPRLSDIRAALYRDLRAADFSREVLQMAGGLAVVPLIDAGWFDCGTPERLCEWLRATPEMDNLRIRIEGAVARAAARKVPALIPSVAA